MSLPDESVLSLRCNAFRLRHQACTLPDTGCPVYCSVNNSVYIIILYPKYLEEK